MKFSEQNKLSFIFILCMVLLSCKNENKALDKFVIPRIILKTTFDTFPIKKNDIIFSNSSDILRKYKFTKEIILTDSTWYKSLKKCNYKNQYNLIDIYYDTSFKRVINSYTFDGLQIYFDQKSFIYNISCDENNKEYKYEYTPLYIANETKQTKLLDYKSGIPLYMEAIDSLGKWKPIGDLDYQICNAGRMVQLINPNEFSMILIKKTYGNYKTKIRIKLVNSTTTYSSNAIEANINYSEFKRFNEGCKTEMTINDIEHRLYGRLSKDYSEYHF